VLVEQDILASSLSQELNRIIRGKTIAHQNRCCN
jgi:hypothetical protein